MKSNIFKIMAVAVVAIFAGYNVYLAQAGNNNAMSDTLLANVEALASGEELPEVVITCSRSCDDGVGQCWTPSLAKKCVWSGYQLDHCTEYPCG